jgi:hypothetical protein
LNHFRDDEGSIPDLIKPPIVRQIFRGGKVEV